MAAYVLGLLSYLLSPRVVDSESRSSPLSKFVDATAFLFRLMLGIVFVE